LSRTGSFGWRVSGGEIVWSEETFRIFGYPKVPSITLDTVLQRVHPDDLALVQRTIDLAVKERTDFEHEYRLLMPDGSVKYIHVVAHAITDQADQRDFIGAVMDVTPTKRAEEALHEAQTELTHITRMTTLGELTASIAHEVNQPLAAVVNAAGASLRWLDRGTPNLDEARSAIEWIIKEGNRAGEVIQRVRALASKTATRKTLLDINEVVVEVFALARRELIGHRISPRMELAPDLPLLLADRVQLQQVIMNLVMNGIEAMKTVMDGPRELVIRSNQDGMDQVLVTVEDCGTGISPENADRLFNPFFTTKSSGMGMGLSICRSIIEAHGGRMSAANNPGPGATFQFTLPSHQEDT
jgi:PAS domain S-box-containing protein